MNRILFIFVLIWHVSNPFFLINIKKKQSMAIILLKWKEDEEEEKSLFNLFESKEKEDVKGISCRKIFNGFFCLNLLLK